MFYLQIAYKPSCGFWGHSGDALEHLFFPFELPSDRQINRGFSSLGEIPDRNFPDECPAILVFTIRYHSGDVFRVPLLSISFYGYSLRTESQRWSYPPTGQGSNEDRHHEGLWRHPPHSGPCFRQN